MNRIFLYCQDNSNSFKNLPFLGRIIWYVEEVPTLLSPRQPLQMNMKWSTENFLSSPLIQQTGRQRLQRDTSRYVDVWIDICTVL